MHYANTLDELNTASQNILGIAFESWQLPQPIVE